MNSISKPRMWESFFWPTIAAALLLAIWHYSVVFTGTKVFPSPMNVRTGVVELLHKHVLWADIGDSLRRVALGFGAAVVVGIPVGLWLGWSAATYQVVNPTLQILRPISPIAWIPVAIIFFGVGDRAAIFSYLSCFVFSHCCCVCKRCFKRAARSAQCGAQFWLVYAATDMARHFSGCAAADSRGCQDRTRHRVACGCGS